MPTQLPLDEAYFVWLYAQVGEVELKNKAKSYWELTRLLHQKEFVWSRQVNRGHDENRAQDGVDLRREFARENNINFEDEHEWVEMPCSVFEMMIALSFKLAWSSDGEMRLWFWILIDNLGLMDCSDANPPHPEMFDDIIERFLYRQYNKNGAGGLFPLNQAHEDQRKVELWYQAQAYILERL